MSTQLAHMVFFKLKDNSATASAKLVAECSKYLKPHAGIAYFSAGTLAQELNDVYQDSDMHNEFIANNKDNWEKVRVFDSHVKA
jgi:hypothetical protein